MPMAPSSDTFAQKLSETKSKKKKRPTFTRCTSQIPKRKKLLTCPDTHLLAQPVVNNAKFDICLTALCLVLQLAKGDSTSSCRPEIGCARFSLASTDER